MIIQRRNFLVGLAAALAAPAIVRTESMMPVKALTRLTHGTVATYECDGLIYSAFLYNNRALNASEISQLFEFMTGKGSHDASENIHVTPVVFDKTIDAPFRAVDSETDSFAIAYRNA